MLILAVMYQQQLKMSRQAENGKVLSEVSQITRRYFITAFKIPAGELTTTEFYTAVADHNVIGPHIPRSARPLRADAPMLSSIHGPASQQTRDPGRRPAHRRTVSARENQTT